MASPFATMMTAQKAPPKSKQNSPIPNIFRIVGDDTGAQQ